MFTEPLTFTIDSVAKNLIRINQDGYSSEYLLRETTGEFRARVRHSNYVGKNGAVTHRHNVELTHTEFGATSEDPDVIRKAYVVLENEAADGITDPLNFDLGLAGFLTSANITKLINWES